jgi:hypothetical protein
VQVRARAAPGAADAADDLAGGDLLAELGRDRREVGVARDRAAAVVDADQVAVGTLGAGLGDLAARRGTDGGPGRRRDVDAGVAVAAAILAERAGLQALDRRDVPAARSDRRGGLVGDELGGGRLGGEVTRLGSLALGLRLGLRRGDIALTALLGLRQWRYRPDARALLRLSRGRVAGLGRLALDLLAHDRRDVGRLHEDDLRAEDRRPRRRVDHARHRERVRGLEALDRALGDRAEDAVVVDAHAALDLGDGRARAAEPQQGRARTRRSDGATSPDGAEPALCAPATPTTGMTGALATAPVSATDVALRRWRCLRLSSAMRRRCARSSASAATGSRRPDRAHPDGHTYPATAQSSDRSPPCVSRFGLRGELTGSRFRVR